MDGAAELEKISRQEATRIRAMLAARLGDVGLAEELVQDAFVEALEHWPGEGLPPNPGGWLATTARRKAIDRLRRDRAGQAKLAHWGPLTGSTNGTPLLSTSPRTRPGASHAKITVASQVGIPLGALWTGQVTPCFRKR